jgi:hypothetical protein
LVLLDLFNLLSAPTRERLEAMWTNYVQHHPDRAALKQVGVTIEPELTSALAAGRKGFEVIRYWYEDPKEDCAFYLTALPNMLFMVAFELRPDWAQEIGCQRKVIASSARRLSADQPGKLQHEEPQ